MDEHKPQKRSALYYYTVIIIVVMFLNALIFPSLMDKKMVEIDYGKFLTMLDTGKVKSVEIENNRIAINPSSSKDKNIYITGRMDDPELVDRLKNAKVEFTKVIPKENSPLLSILLTWIIPIGILMLFGNLMMKSMQKRMGGNAMQFGKSNAKMYVSAQSGKRFNDVAGQDEAKEALTEIVDFLHNPEKYKKIGAQMPKGALLVGPPGTGKTLLAKAVAGEANVPFFSISGSEFVEMFVGMGASRIRDLFKQAKEKAPCIVFIDEIDTIGKKRDNGSGLGGNDEREQTLNQLLSEMDGFDGGIGVVILAATNRPDSLDKALLRPGRFDRRIPVELPDLGGREAILKVHAQNVNVSSDIDYNAIARSTSGASGAELANIVNEAALLAVKSGRDIVEQQDFEESVETVIAGYQRKGAVISDKEKKIIAYHEIGHALVAAMQKHSAPVHKITIIPRTSGALGYTMQVAEDESVLMSKEEAIDKITTFTGGRAAEEVIFNTCTSGASNDIEQATKIARAMVTRLGMSEEFDMVALETVSNQYLGGDTSLACSSDTAAKIDEEVFKIVKACHKNAIEILENNIDKLHELANYLLEKETITGDEFMEILNLN
ncbi:ATP-dependent zinc metalloprotease FtsH [Clostridioides difficile]|uniref:ATP-dependent zinc metalloprotease FtsH n=11 Tax=cellular organisms TaxID=131567 RepID=A0A6N3H7L7_CLODI|nr:ATP-dependent zinc metalloprotease FtsH [Clostridioides difficile]AQU09792.1 cell division protein FtsH [Clostridioides difficile]ASN89514.1 cell division protein FtsH [Clostridioides difficile]AUA25556.1 ATP-dependent zinc metalloprotease FtsH [Clostridioides difficile]EAA0006045.1 ATP-dependent metallopeptidase FtsH/Yme1/Tma family protein [Clostridioides difficile]EGT3672721.1 ATP-dependent metallopeptidase FtsH/Yme1/Tma family protein [Clostridioides difficile]